jgi:hypothetical protein
LLDFNLKLVIIQIYVLLVELSTINDTPLGGFKGGEQRAEDEKRGGAFVCFVEFLAYVKRLCNNNRVGVMARKLALDMELRRV